MQISKDQKKELLSASFITALIMANILSVKLFNFFGIVVDAGLIAYPITFLVTDIIGEVWGKKAAIHVIVSGFWCALLVIVLEALAIILPPSDYFKDQIYFSSMLLGSMRIVCASLATFLVSQYIDILIFHKIREKTGVKKLWLRNNVGTIVSQFVDTCIFILLAFSGVIPFSGMPMMIGIQWLLKVGIALLDTPFCYLFIAWCKGSYDADFYEKGVE